MATSYITGLDIDSYSVRAVLLRRRGETTELLKCVQMVSPESIFSENHTLVHQSSVKILKEVRKQVKWRGRKTALALADNAVVSKTVQVQPGLEADELAYAIEREMEAYTSARESELSLDYYPLGQDLLPGAQLPGAQLPGAQMQDYQVYAARQAVVDSYLQPLTRAGFSARVMTLQGQALQKIWQRASQTSPECVHWLLVYLGNQHMTICTHPLNGAPYIKDLVLDTSPAGSGQGGGLAEAKTARSLLRQVNLYNSMFPQQKCAGVWLMGQECGEAEAQLGSQLDVPVVRLDPLRLVEYSRGLRNKLPEQGCGFGLAMGLALNGLDWMEGRACV